jgi:hypothetical protein
MGEDNNSEQKKIGRVLVLMQMCIASTATFLVISKKTAPIPLSVTAIRNQATGHLSAQKREVRGCGLWHARSRFLWYSYTNG